MKPNFEKIVKENSVELLYRATCLTQDQDLAKDLVQEVFIDFWEKQAGINIETSISAYLGRMLKNRFLKFIAAKTKQDKLIIQLGHSMSNVEYSFLQLLEANDIAQTLSEIIEQLPPVMKEVYLLRDQDYSIKEIARILDVAEQTVKSYNSEGRRRIRHQILLKHPEISTSMLLLLTTYFTER